MTKQSSNGKVNRYNLKQVALFARRIAAIRDRMDALDDYDRSDFFDEMKQFVLENLKEILAMDLSVNDKMDLLDKRFNEKFANPRPLSGEMILCDDGFYKDASKLI